MMCVFRRAKYGRKKGATFSIDLAQIFRGRYNESLSSPSVRGNQGDV